MKKQDNESLIQEIQKRLDWYTMEASDEEFDADEVQNLLKLLDSLTPEEEKDRLSSDEVVDNFWKYCAEREEEERILAEADETEKKKEHKVLHYFQKHRAVAVAAAVLIVIMLGGSWQMAVNAEKHGGFFWWMDKNEEGTTMITSPETHVRDSIKKVKENYYSIEMFLKYIKNMLIFHTRLCNCMKNNILCRGYKSLKRMNQTLYMNSLIKDRMKSCILK